MLVAILAVALAATSVNTTSRDELGRVCRTKTTQITSCENACVCPVRRHAKKKARVAVAQKQVEAQKQQQSQTQSQQVIINITASEPRLVSEPKPAPSPFPLGIGIRGAVGAWSCNPHLFGLLGLRFRVLPLHLGLDANTQFYWGDSLMLMVYPIQGPLAWHLDAGALWLWKSPGFATQDVPRRWDLAVGTGLEAQLVPHLSLTLDWRLTLPNPGVLGRAAWPDADGRYLNTGNVVGNSLLRSQIMLGLMLHTW